LKKRSREQSKKATLREYDVGAGTLRVGVLWIGGRFIAEGDWTDKGFMDYYDALGWVIPIPQSKTSVS